MLDAAGFDLLSYLETERWHARMTAAYQAVIDASPQLTAEMGEAGFLAMFGEMAMTLERQPYRRRVLVSAVKQ